LAKGVIMEKKDILVAIAIVIVLLTICVTGALRSQSEDRAKEYQIQIEKIEQTINERGIE